MKNVLRAACIISSLLACANLSAQAPFTFANANSRLHQTDFHSGCSVSVVDMDGDGMDDIARMDDGRILYYELQKTNTKFDSIYASTTSSGSAWAMVVGDADNNGRKDVAVGFGSSAKIVMANAALNNFTLTSLPSSNFFLQNMNFADIDNDGMLDIWGCNDNGTSKMWGNSGSGAYPATTNFFSPATYPASDNSGNYGTIWTDFDNDNDLDLYVSHCRQGVNSATDPRRINQLFINDGNNYYDLDSMNARGLNIGWQTWTASFEDIDNDGDFDCLLTNHDHACQLFLNNGSGYFTEITNTGFDVDITPIESKMEDLDNDGFVDIIISGGDERVFHNNGDNTFTLVNAFDNNDMLSFATGDLNHDGLIDLYASYGSIYTTPTSTDDVLWINTTANANHFLTFDMQGTVSNRDAVGARVRIYGSFGMQTREVRAGESYGTTNTFQCHFGLGAATGIDSAVINWPSGIITHIGARPGDQFVKVIESTCVSPDNIVTAVGPAVLCPGQSVTLSAPSGYTYVWSTGATTQTITVTTAGEYNVQINDGSNCQVISKTIAVLASPDETPAISAAGETEFCLGGNVVISGPAGETSYAWSNGAITQDITVTAAGSYTLTVPGACANWTSTPVTVTVLAAAAPVGSGTTITAPQAVTLNVTGNDPVWYDAATGGNVVNTGLSFTTPVLSATTSYWVGDSESFGGGTANTGMPYHTGSSNFSGSTSTNADLEFTVLDNCVLESVKVYTDEAGLRIVELRDAADNVLQSYNANIPLDTSLVMVNFTLAPGSYKIGTNAAQNNTLLGFDAPRLMRNNGGTDYPYVVNNLISIDNSSEGDNYYYYFYDWVVKTPPTTCNSELTQVTVTYQEDTSSVGIANVFESNFALFPNPSNGLVNIRSKQNIGGEVALQVMDVTGKVVLTKTLTNWNANTATQLDLSGMAKGIYTVRVKANNQTGNLKVTLQ